MATFTQSTSSQFETIFETNMYTYEFSKTLQISKCILNIYTFSILTRRDTFWWKEKVYIYIYIYIYIYVCLHVCVYVCMYVCMYAIPRRISLLLVMTAKVLLSFAYGFFSFSSPSIHILV